MKINRSIRYISLSSLSILSAIAIALPQPVLAQPQPRPQPGQEAPESEPEQQAPQSNDAEAYYNRGIEFYKA